MNDARKRAAGLLPAALLAAACVTLAPAQAARAADWYHWIGAGTGGNTATDPTDPTTQWNNPANWRGGIVPTPNSIAYLPLTNEGYVNAQSAALAGLFVDGTSAEGACHIADGVAITTQPGYGVFVGYEGQGRIVQTGGSVTTYGAYGGYGLLYVGGPETAGTGRYELHGGNVECYEAKVGYQGTGILEQTGGTLIVTGTMYVGVGSLAWPGNGVLNVGGGVLRAGDLYVGQSGGPGSLNILSTQALITAENMSLGPNSTITAVPGSAIHISCVGYPGFYIYSKDEPAFSDLQNLALIFDGATPLRRARLEVAGRDLGPTASGFVDNFALGTLFIGGAEPALLWLFDDYDNGNRSSAEALYVHDIVIGPGSTLDLRGFNLYYDGLYDNQGTVLGGTPVFVPEPGSVMLLALGLGIVRCLRFFSRAGA